MAKYGLVGRDISYSFSKKYFTDKFEREKRKDHYQNFDIPTLSHFPSVVSENPDLKGLNVTIPYKEEILKYLDKVDDEAEEIGAVNTIKITRNDRLIGYNTDHYGFAQSLVKYLPLKQKTALILGSGGASKAIAYVLRAMGFEFKFVSRKKTADNFTYSELNKSVLDHYLMIINCTPIGTFPNTKDFPKIPYQHLTSEHFLYDLIYNPLETEFLKLGRMQRTKTCNGLKMLEYQAEKAWSIWKS